MKLAYARKKLQKERMHREAIQAAEDNRERDLLLSKSTPPPQTTAKQRDGSRETVLCSAQCGKN